MKAVQHYFRFSRKWYSYFLLFAAILVTAYCIDHVQTELAREYFATEKKRFYLVFLLQLASFLGTVSALYLLLRRKPSGWLLLLIFVCVPLMLLQLLFLINLLFVM